MNHTIDEFYTRQTAQNDTRHLYIFTDNNDRTSRPSATFPNITSGWYFDKYHTTTMYPLHFGTVNNPTSAVIRGLANAFPISTMRGYGKQWREEDVELFKKVLKDEIKTIKRALKSGAYVGLKYPSGMGSVGRYARLPESLQKWLDKKLFKHLNINNATTAPKQ